MLKLKVYLKKIFLKLSMLIKGHALDLVNCQLYLMLLAQGNISMTNVY